MEYPAVARSNATLLHRPDTGDLSAFTRHAYVNRANIVFGFSLADCIVALTVDLGRCIG